MTEPSKEAIDIWASAFVAYMAASEAEENPDKSAALVIQEALAERDARIAELAGHHDEGWAQAKLKDDRIIALEAEVARLREALKDLLDLDQRCGWHSKQADAALAALEARNG